MRFLFAACLLSAVVWTRANEDALAWAEEKFIQDTQALVAEPPSLEGVSQRSLQEVHDLISTYEVEDAWVDIDGDDRVQSGRNLLQKPGGPNRQGGPNRRQKGPAQQGGPAKPGPGRRMVHLPQCNSVLQEVQRLSNEGVQHAHDSVLSKNAEDWLPKGTPMPWSRTALQRAMSRLGDIENVGHVLERLYNGKPLKMAAFGGSLTEAGGCYPASPGKLINEGVRTFNSELYEDNGFCKQTQGWLHDFMAFVQDTWPHTEHVLVNNGAKDTAEEADHLKEFLFESCYLDSLPDELDLVFIEITRKQNSHKTVAALTHMLQTLHPNVAVVLVQPFRYDEDTLACMSKTPTECTRDQIRGMYSVSAWFETIGLNGGKRDRVKDQLVNVTDASNTYRTYFRAALWHQLPIINFEAIFHQMQLDNNGAPPDTPPPLKALSQAAVQMLVTADALRAGGLLPHSSGEQCAPREFVPPVFPMDRGMDVTWVKRRGNLEQCEGE